MKRIILFVVFSFCIHPLFVSAQKKQKTSEQSNISGLTGDENETLDDAEFFFGEKNYMRALTFYLLLVEAHPENPYLKYKAGICYLYSSDEREKSIVLFKEIENETHPKIKDLNFYIGRAYHLNYKFTDAVEYFNKFLAENPPVDKKVLTDLYIRQCKNGEVLTNEKVTMNVENIGPEINTAGSEYVPVISSDGSILIYTYRGERSTGGLMDDKFQADRDGDYYEDIFISQKVGSHWLYPEGIGTNINTKGHDADIALSADGQKLFIYKSTPKDQGDIYMSKLDGEVWTTPVKLGPNINTNSWEGSCSLSADEETLYFASERPGGLGARDIYISRWVNGEWDIPEHLDSTINTIQNDDAPFIHPDGVTLFFSSEAHNSVGGYDIMSSRFENGKWTNPLNMGSPINSAGDERFYVLSADGETGFFSSDRKGGYGQQDIYIAQPGIEGDKPVLALVLGVVKVNDKPVDATIKVTDAETGERKGEHHSNSASGKYLLALTPGNNYKIAFEVGGMDSKIEYLNVKSLDTYIQVQKDVPLYTEEYKKANNIEDTSLVSLQEDLELQIQKYKEEGQTEYYEANRYKDILKKYGDVQKDGVTYAVELGTYENAADFDSTKYAGLGKIQKQTTADGNTIFSLGTFNTLLDAEIFKYKVIEKDSLARKLAIVTVNDQGERKIIQQYRASEYTKKNYVPPGTPVVKSKKMVSLSDNVEYNNLVKDKGTFQIEGLSFKLEIGTYKDTNDFKLQELSKLGVIEKKTNADGTIRYTIGNFKTLAEADRFRKKVAESNSEAANAFVTVFYYEQKQTVKEFFSSPVVVETAKSNPTIDTTAAPVVAEKVAPSTIDTTVAITVQKDPIVSPTPTPVDTSIAKSSSPCQPDPAVDFSFFVGKDLNDPIIYNKLISTGGNICAEGLVFTVQIGAYRRPENFKYNNLKIFGNADVRNYPDGITRFTMRQFETLREAEEFRQQVISRETKDAWITAWYQNKRMLLTELIPLNFYNKAVN